MTANEIRELSMDQLNTQVKELKQELFNLKFQKTLGQLQNTTKIRQVKRDIARIKTIITEKKTEIGGFVSGKKREKSKRRNSSF